MDPGTSVSARLAALAVDDKGRLTPQLMADAAVRCGLLVDLAVEERLVLTEDSVELDARPTGFPAADRLLLAMDAEPERTLDSWFAERRIGLAEVAETLVGLGAWTRRRSVWGARFAVGEPRQRAVDLQRELGEQPPDARSAAVSALGAIAHLIGATRRSALTEAPPEVPDPLPAALGPHAWVLTAALDHLRSARAEHATRAGALRAGLISGPGPG